MRRILLAAVSTACLLTSPALAAPGDKALDDVRILSADDMEGRLVGSPGGAKARAYIKQRFEQIGLGVSEQPFTFKGRDAKDRSGVNLVVRIDGAQKGGKVIVVTAHYDHLGVRDGQTYNGADDNASGVAGLLAIAEHLKRHPPRHSVLLVWLDGEERGLLGATAFLREPPVPREAMAVNVNLDMVGRNDKGRLFVVGPLRRPVLTSYVRAAACRTPVPLMLGHDKGWSASEDWTYQSDQGVFDQAGIPFVYLGVEDHEDYHRPTDDPERLQPTFFAGAVQAAIALVDELDADLAPLRR
jgi:Zn-dependent M28 family amino/carboxypeptidase